MNNIKVGIIGCGWFGNFHTDNLLKMERVEVVAFASSNSEKLKAIGEKVKGSRLYSSHKEMFEKEPHLDAVFICVPPDCHGDVEILAARKGIHLYVEKPIEVSLEKAHEIEAAINQAGIICSVGYQERYNPEVENIRIYIKDKKIGLASGRWVGGMPGVHWWRRKEKSGGQIVEQSTHIFDMLRYFFGDAQNVYSTAMKGIVENVPEYDIEDASSTTVIFKSGVIATVFTACYLQDLEAYRGAGLQIICNDAIIDYDWNKEVRYTLKSEVKKVDIEANSHFASAQTFIEAVKTGNGQSIKSTYSDSVKTFEMTMAANESIKSGKPVILNQ
ncbi:MAG: Gfo/Idh/MocA family oxidoreductase [Vallitaleaceae bacterium]|nr:Gfo/Idh/MocA family oxidoreductase [Vallitaleaceae bacterium]